METAKAARERRARAPEELIKKTRARNSGAVGMRPAPLIQAWERLAPQIPSFDTQANMETDMISKSFKLPKGRLTCPQRSYSEHDCHVERHRCGYLPLCA